MSVHYGAVSTPDSDHIASMHTWPEPCDGVLVISFGRRKRLYALCRRNDSEQIQSRKRIDTELTLKFEIGPFFSSLQVRVGLLKCFHLRDFPKRGRGLIFEMVFDEVVSHKVR